MNCPNCGKEIERNQKFCTRCGAKLTSIEEEIKETEQKTPQISNKIIYIIKSKPFIISSIILILIVFI